MVRWSRRFASSSLRCDVLKKFAAGGASPPAAFEGMLLNPDTFPPGICPEIFFSLLERVGLPRVWSLPPHTLGGHLPPYRQTATRGRGKLPVMELTACGGSLRSPQRRRREAGPCCPWMKHRSAWKVGDIMHEMHVFADSEGFVQMMHPGGIPLNVIHSEDISSRSLTLRGTSNARRKGRSYCCSISGLISMRMGYGCSHPGHGGDGCHLHVLFCGCGLSLQPLHETNGQFDMRF